MRFPSLALIVVALVNFAVAPNSRCAEVTIGALLPPEETQALSIREGLLLAQQHVNKSSLSTLRVLIRGRSGQWGADAVEAGRMVTEDGTMALIAPPDGAASHLVLQVSGRTAVPVVTLNADSSVGHTGVPWMLRIVPTTAEEAKLIFNSLPVSTATNGWLALIPNERTGREIARDLKSAARACNVKLTRTIEVNPLLTNANFIRDQALAIKPDGVLLWLDPACAGRMAKDLRATGYAWKLAGPARLNSPDFFAAAASASEGFLVAGLILTTRTAERWLSFREAYKTRWLREPGFTAAISYDAVMLLSQLLSSEDFQMPPHRLPPNFSWPGVTGDLTFDQNGDRKICLQLLQAHGGHFLPPDPQKHLSD